MEQQIKTLEEDRRFREEENAVRAQRDTAKIDELTRKNQKIENILRENTKDLLERKRRFQVMERKLKEEKTTVAEDIVKLKDDYEVQKVKNQTVEKVET
jgi:predicted transcriptional regulator